MRSDKYINNPLKVADSDNKTAITAMCESIMLRELKALDLTSHADTLEDKACRRIEAAAAALMAVNV